MLFLTSKIARPDVKIGIHLDWDDTLCHADLTVEHRSPIINEQMAAYPAELFRKFGTDSFELYFQAPSIKNHPALSERISLNYQSEYLNAPHHFC